LRLHREDFERERRAHEIAIIVKNFAEDRVKKMEKEMQELKDKLNPQVPNYIILLCCARGYGNIFN
jgi:hypothetical protein